MLSAVAIVPCLLTRTLFRHCELPGSASRAVLTLGGRARSRPRRMHTDRRWSFGMTAPALWEAMAGVGNYRRWWPWLRSFEARGLVEGDTWRCVVQPPLPYRLRFWVGLDEVVTGRFVTATVGGDVQGSAHLMVEDLAHGCCEARLVATLAPGSPALRLVTALAQPVARFGHDWILDTGAHQFASRSTTDSRRAGQTSFS